MTSAPLRPRERDRWIADLQYLNLAEMRAVCRAHDLPLHICLERPDGTLRQSKDRDRKDIVLARIAEYAFTGRRPPPTVYAQQVVAEIPLPEKLSSRTRIRYGQYEKHNPHFLATMERLTDGAFRTGMIARLVLRDFWTAGEAPTLRQFADEWLRATSAHQSPRPEGAYLVDLARGEGGPGWKERRVERAEEALRVFEALTRGHPAT